MKRTASTLVLLAGLGGGGCVSPETQAQKAQQQVAAGGFGTVTRGKQVANVQGPMGEQVMATASVRGAAPGGVTQAGGATALLGPGMVIRPVSGSSGPGYVTQADGYTGSTVPGVGGSAIRDGYGPPPGAWAGASSPYGPRTPNMPNTGIVPVPGQGPPGAVAAGPGAILPGMGGPGMSRPGMANGRSSINFTGPAGMKVTWQLPDGSFNDERDALTAPKEYNFLQGQVYRLRLTSILPDYPGRSFYPTLEVAAASPRTLTFLAHSSVPITFSADDFAQAKAGNLVVKVVYLPDPANQDFSTVFGAEEVVSTRLEPGADPVAEAQRRGTVLAVIRMGNIDLENRVSPPMTAPPPGAMPALPPGVGPGAPLGNPRPTPANPPGVSSVRPPVAPALPPITAMPAVPPLTPSAPAAPIAPPMPSSLSAGAPTDLPPAPIVPSAPLAPGPKSK